MFVSRLLDTDGDGGGTTAGNVDGSSVAVELLYQPTVVSTLRYLVLTMTDAGLGDPVKFGGLTALTNGIDLECKLKLTPFTVGWSLLDGAKTNLAFFDCRYDAELQTHWVGADDMIKVIFDITKIRGSEFRLRPTEEIAFTINDNLSGLTSLTVRVIAEEH